MEDNKAIGAIIEDTYISAGLVNLETGKIVENSLRRRKIDPKSPKEVLISSWANVLKEVAVYSENRDLKLGLGILGPCDYRTGVFLSNDPARYGSLFNSNVKELLAKELEISPSVIRLISDSVCFFQGEVFGGAVRYYERSFGVTLGIGLGSAFYLNGKVVDANLWSAPFKEGIAEEFLSIRYLLKRFKDLSGIEVKDLAEMKTFDSSLYVQRVFDEFADNLSDFLGEVIATQNPEAIVIGGNMQASNRIFFDRLIANLKSKNYTTPVFRTYLGEVATVIGAASVWKDQNLLDKDSY